MKKLVLKLGTSTLTAKTDKISHGKIEDIARQILELKKDYNIILVSSGAIAAAKQFSQMNGWGNQVQSKQALAAIGQPMLMKIYNEVFHDFGLKTAQCLMSYRDFENKNGQKNTKNTLNELIKNNYIPIINENDTVGTEEIILGDNDKLSALVASLMDADLLVIASDIDGVFDKNPHLNKNAKLVTEITDLKKVKSFIEEKKSELGTGGMTSKILAAEICRKKKIEMWIVNGGKNNFLADALKSKIKFTKFNLKI